MQTTSTNIRDQRFAREQEKLSGAAFAARRAQVEAIKEAILTDGSPELHDDSTALSTHFKLRKGRVGMDEAEAQLYSHAAGAVIRFWVYGGDFGVRVRDLVLLPSGDKGFDLWLESDGKLFPHEGKYALAGQQVMMSLKSEMNAMNGR